MKNKVLFIDARNYYTVADRTLNEWEVAKKHLKTLREAAKKSAAACDKKEKKQLQVLWDGEIASVEEIVGVIKEAHWFYGKFGEGEYKDIAAIEGKGWSLTLGAYVGVTPVEDDGVDFKERMAEIHKKLLLLQAESNELMDAISQNMKEMGL